MAQHLRRYDLIVAVLLFLAAIPLQYFETFAVLEESTLSIRQQLRMDFRAKHKQLFPDDKIFIVNTDEKFYQLYKSFPLRREDIGRIVANLRKLGARVVAIDMLMDFPSSYGEDPKLAELLHDSGNTLLVNQGIVREGVLQRISHPTKVLDDASASAYTNITTTSKWVTSMSRLHIHPEAIPMVDGWPFSVKAAAMYLGVEPKWEPGTLHLGDLDIPLDRNNNIYIDYPPLDKGVRYLSQGHQGMGAWEFLDLSDKDDRDLDELSDWVKDKLVILGDTSEVSHDWFDSPAGAVYGVEIIADTVASILAGGSLRLVSAETQAALPVVCLIAMLAIGLLLKTPVMRLGAVVSLAAAFSIWAVEIHVRSGLIAPMSYVLPAILLSYLLIEFRQYMIERDQKLQISKTFGQYIPAELVEEMNRTGEKVQVGGESREMTVLFSDVRGFTTISEGLSPNDLTRLMNAFLSPMTKVIQQHRGTIDKYMGDAIMAFWGAPLVDADHARHGVEAALRMVTTMNDLSGEFVAKGWKPLKMGIGLNTGVMNVGNMGSDFRLAYTVLGDAVNLGSRIESLTKQYGVDVMVSQFTRAAVPDLVTREIDLVRVKGKDEPVGLFEPIGFDGEVDAQVLERLDRHGKALNLYRHQDWNGAEAILKALSEEEPNRLIYRTYLERIVTFREHPPGDQWDGVYTHKEKS